MERTKTIEYRGGKFVVVLDKNGFVGYRKEDESNANLDTMFLENKPTAEKIEDAEKIVRAMLNGIFKGGDKIISAD